MQLINKILRLFFFLFIVRPFILLVIGLNVRHFERLRIKGPAIIVANHNSHLDTMVIMSLFPLSWLKRVHPVAAADYFLRNRFLKWFSLSIIGIIPLPRKMMKGCGDALGGCSSVLEGGGILIFYPEGSRGEPEKIADFKAGIAHLAKRYPEIPVVPIFLHGCGKSWPKDESIIVPFFCDVFIGEFLFWTGDRKEYLNCLTERINDLAAEGNFPAWE